MKPSFFKLSSTTISASLLGLLILFIFGLPLFPEGWYVVLYKMNYTLIFIFSVLALKRHRKIILYIALINLVVLWITQIFDLVILRITSDFLIIIFFGIIVSRFLVQIARSEKADIGVILESISGYLLLGTLFGIITVILLLVSPGAVVFHDAIDPSLADIFYFTFVTMTTLGFGDVLPVTDPAQSLSILIALSGQLYIAIIVAMLVGKYISGIRDKNVS